MTADECWIMCEFGATSCPCHIGSPREVTFALNKWWHPIARYYCIYINDTAIDVSSDMRLFADDSMLYREIRRNEDAEQLQRDLNRLWQWSLKWQMCFKPANGFRGRNTQWQEYPAPPVPSRWPPCTDGTRMEVLACNTLI